MELEELIQEGDRKILLVVLDGLGGLGELEEANTPNLDSLCQRSALGLHLPVDYGITPGSGPGHLALFGYDPLKYEIGRGVLEALGVGLELREGDVAIRGNFATVEYRNGRPILIDRRAGRIRTEENRRLVERIKDKIKEIDGVEVILKSGREHRFVLVLRFGDKLKGEYDKVLDTDPQRVGVPPLEPVPKNRESERVAEVAKAFVEETSRILKDEERANYVLLRGFSKLPKIPSHKERFKLRSCAIAVYPMYRGLAKLVGMDVIDFVGEGLEEEVEALKKVWGKYDFYFLHVKKTDSFGEDGNREGKVKVLEEFDKVLPKILELKPDVLCITGDHSTPPSLKSHSWHPVPVLIHSPYVLGGTSKRFTERECLKGELGIFPAKKLMNLLLAHSLRLKKFGA